MTRKYILSAAAIEARSKGGLANLAINGMKDMSVMGKKSGRPRRKTLAEIREEEKEGD